MFIELNIPYSAASSKSLVSEAARMGFDGVVLTHTVMGTIKPTDACRIPSFEAIFPGQKKEHLSREHVRVNLPDSPSGFRVWSRVNLVFDTPEQMHSLLLPASITVLNTYDIIAIRPASLKTLEQACKHSLCDIISFDFTKKLPFQFKSPLLEIARKRGIFLECSFSGALRDPSSRTYLLQYSAELIRACKGRHILLSSEATDVLQLRNPYDVINLGIMIGLRENQAVAAISTCASQVIRHAQIRKHTGVSGIVASWFEATEPRDSKMKDVSSSGEEESDHNEKTRSSTLLRKKSPQGAKNNPAGKILSQEVKSKKLKTGSTQKVNQKNNRDVGARF